MADAGFDENPNGVVEDKSFGKEKRRATHHRSIDIGGKDGGGGGSHRKHNLHSLSGEFLSHVLLGSPKSPASFFHRIYEAILMFFPLLKDATMESLQAVTDWMKEGGAWRSILVISVGLIAGVGLTAFVAFLLFFCAAAINAVVISLLMSVAAAGGFLAFFFTCLVGIYMVFLLIAASVISTITFFTVIALIVATGWIGFFYVVAQVVTKGFHLTKHSVNAAGSMVSAYTAGRHAHGHHQ